MAGIRFTCDVINDPLIASSSSFFFFKEPASQGISKISRIGENSDSLGWMDSLKTAYSRYLFVNNYSITHNTGIQWIFNSSIASIFFLHDGM